MGRKRSAPSLCPPYHSKTAEQLTRYSFKWITSGTYADYFLTLAKETDGKFTLVVVPRQEGLTTRHIAISGSTTAGTAFVDYDDVKVPLEMVVGERGKGFKYVVSNFNHERLFISMQALRCSRVCLEDSIQ